MDEKATEEETIRVVVNHEEQYSIWPADRELPLGWRDGGKCGTKAECLAYIEEVWTDMRPLSLRRAMEKAAAEPKTFAEVAAKPQVEDARDDLVTYLATGDHPVQATSRSIEDFRKRIESGFIYLKFTDTRGGTELGVELDPAATDAGAAKELKGNMRIVGSLTLNYRKVRLIADLAVDTLRGVGRLNVV